MFLINQHTLNYSLFLACYATLYYSWLIAWLCSTEGWHELEGTTSNGLDLKIKKKNVDVTVSNELIVTTYQRWRIILRRNTNSKLWIIINNMHSWLLVLKEIWEQISITNVQRPQHHILHYPLPKIQR